MSYEDFLRDFVDRDEPHTISATDAATDLLALALDGEAWAHSKVYDLLRSQLVAEVKTRRAARHVVTYIDRAGRKRRMNTAVSRAVVDATGDVSAYQLVIEWDMDTAQLNALLRDLQKSATELRQRVDAVRALLAALAEHPDCTTAREAWIAEGRSLDEIDLSA